MLLFRCTYYVHCALSIIFRWFVGLFFLILALLLSVAGLTAVVGSLVNYVYQVQSQFHIPAPFWIPVSLIALALVFEACTDNPEARHRKTGQSSRELYQEALKRATQRPATLNTEVMNTNSPA